MGIGGWHQDGHDVLIRWLPFLLAYATTPTCQPDEAHIRTVWSSHI